MLQEVSLGESIEITRGRKPLARLVPYEQPSARPKVGTMIDESLSIPDEALRPMKTSELREWGL